MPSDTEALFSAMRRIFQEQHTLLIVALKLAATVEDGSPAEYAIYRAQAGNVLHLAESTLPASDLESVYVANPKRSPKVKG